MTHWLAVAVATPAHSGLAEPLTYRADAPLAPGHIVRVPLGAREVLGVVWGQAAEPTPERAAQVRPLAGLFDGLAPLADDWRQLIAFTARYYQRALGEVALAALPPQLRTLSSVQMARRLKRLGEAPPASAADAIEHAALTAEQAAALVQIDQQPGPFLLHGATGSGKTEVYMRAAARVLAQEPAAQVLVLVPEINLTPQLEARFAARFGASACVSLHSGLTPPQRLAAWLAAHGGRARIVLGTRVAVLASMPGLRLIVVDEEHDPSYKQQEGARYSARDLALYRGRLLGARVILGSATPALESWHASTPAPEGPGRYQRLAMPRRVGLAPGDDPAAGLPRVRRVDMTRQPKGTLIAAPLLAAIGERVARGEQACCCSTAAAGRRCCTAPTAAGRANARTAAPTACSTRSTAPCAATTAASPSACRAPARPAATSTSAPWGAAPSSWKSAWPNCWPTCAAPTARQRASPASTPTARAARASWKARWPRCTPATWTCWSARR
jgi:primosomal protein N' (replication factor Y)